MRILCTIVVHTSQAHDTTHATQTRISCCLRKDMKGGWCFRFFQQWNCCLPKSCASASTAAWACSGVLITGKIKPQRKILCHDCLSLTSSHQDSTPQQSETTIIPPTLPEHPDFEHPNPRHASPPRVRPRGHAPRAQHVHTEKPDESGAAKPPSRGKKHKKFVGWFRSPILKHLHILAIELSKLKMNCWNIFFWKSHDSQVLRSTTLGPEPAAAAVHHSTRWANAPCQSQTNPVSSKRRSFTNLAKWNKISLT